MNVGICDDEEIIIKILAEILREIVKNNELNVEFFYFNSGKQLIDNVSHMDVVFLDIDMPTMDGLETGKLLNSLNPGCVIIVSTSMISNFKEAFKINAHRYVTKPFCISELEEALCSAYFLKRMNVPIDMYYKRIKISVPQRDIEFIQAFNGYVEIFVGDKVYRRDMSLNDFECDLDNEIFVRVHKKYIVNLLHVRGYSNHNIAINSSKILVSRRKIKLFEEKLLYFQLRRNCITGGK